MTSPNLDAMEAVARRLEFDALRCRATGFSEGVAQNIEAAEQAILALIARIRELEGQVNGSSQDHALTDSDARPSTRPEGWVLVPVEPTEAMRHEGIEALSANVPGHNDGMLPNEVYRAMIAARPYADATTRPEGWQPIETAPKDGTTIQARIPGHGDDNLIMWIANALENERGSCGAWTFTHEEQEPPSCWSDGWCWEVNEDGVKSAHPTHWKPAPPAARPHD